MGEGSGARTLAAHKIGSMGGGSYERACISTTIIYTVAFAAIGAWVTTHNRRFAEEDGMWRMVSGGEGMAVRVSESGVSFQTEAGRGRVSARAVGLSRGGESASEMRAELGAGRFLSVNGGAQRVSESGLGLGGDPPSAARGEKGLSISCEGGGCGVTLGESTSVRVEAGTVLAIGGREVPMVISPSAGVGMGGRPGTDEHGGACGRGDLCLSGSEAVVRATGGGAYMTSISDARHKGNITEIPSQEALRELQRLRPVTYRWASDNRPSSGFVAQEVAGDESATHYELSSILAIIVASL